MNLFFPLILDIISRSLHRPSCREATSSVAGPLNTGVRFGLDGQMDRRMDGQTESGRRACQRRLVAGWRGRREGASAGGFEAQPWLL